jgi:hypothetical protein
MQARAAGVNDNRGDFHNVARFYGSLKGSPTHVGRDATAAGPCHGTCVSRLVDPFQNATCVDFSANGRDVGWGSHEPQNYFTPSVGHHYSNRFHRNPGHTGHGQEPGSFGQPSDVYVNMC